MRCVFLSAGEPSGDLHGAAVARALRARWPEIRLRGLGGPRMAEAGVELVAHVDDLAVMGFAEVLAHLPYFVRLYWRVRHSLRDDPPDLVLPIDYPGFNLRLAGAAREAGIPVLYYIAPQVWAWHRSRLGKLIRHAEHVAVILPFEEALFRKSGGNASFVGHPLLDRPPADTNLARFARSLGLDPERPILALFPGSRAQEVKRHGPLFSETARRIQRSHPELQAVVAVSGTVPAGLYEADGLPGTADGWTLLHHARAALVKSGTGTLEAALAGTPMVVAYRMHPLTYALARRLVHVDHVGLVNLVANERLAPELLQADATPERLAAALEPLLDRGSAERARALAGLARVRDRLQGPDGAAAADRVVAIAARLVERAT